MIQSNNISNTKHANWQKTMIAVNGQKQKD